MRYKGSQYYGRRGIACALLIAGAVWGLARRADAAEISLSRLAFHGPTPAIPYWHFSARLALPERGPVYIERLEANGECLRDHLLVEDETIEPERPRERRRLVIASAVKSPRPEASYYRPTLIGRLNWRGGETYAITLTLRLGGKEGEARSARLEGKAPASGGYTRMDWKDYQSVTVSETAGHPRVHEPVEVTLLFYPDQLEEPARELRVAAYDHRSGEQAEVPFQVLDTKLLDGIEAPMYDEHGKRKPASYFPTRSVTLVFPAMVNAKSSRVYLVYYGNPAAAPPSYVTDLRVSGKAPGTLIENAYYRAKLHGDSGMLDEISLRAKPEFTFVHKKETNGAIQWNPDVYAPPRPWVHLSDWAPGKHDYEYEETRGPLVFRTRRWGQMPLMPEVVCSMEYEFYAGVPYFRMRSSMRVRHDVDVQALRNAEIVFAREMFSEAAWWNEAEGRVETRAIVSAPDLTEWTMAADTPWLAFFDRDKACGFAGIQIAYANGGLEGRLRTQNPYLYITTGPWVYWTRALAYPYGGPNPQQLIRIHAGSVFLEEWAYLPFHFEGKGAAIFRAPQDWRRKLTRPLESHVHAPIDPRMEIPEEIYIEPSATGWEE